MRFSWASVRRVQSVWVSHEMLKTSSVCITEYLNCSPFWKISLPILINDIKLCMSHVFEEPRHCWMTNMCKNWELVYFIFRFLLRMQNCQGNHSWSLFLLSIVHTCIYIYIYIYIYMPKCIKCNFSVFANMMNVVF